jgi:hypothetical protein
MRPAHAARPRGRTCGTLYQQVDARHVLLSRHKSLQSTAIYIQLNANRFNGSFKNDGHTASHRLCCREVAAIRSAGVQHDVVVGPLLALWLLQWA